MVAFRRVRPVRQGCHALATVALVLAARGCLIHPEKDYPVGSAAGAPSSSGGDGETTAAGQGGRTSDDAAGANNGGTAGGDTTGAGAGSETCAPDECVASSCDGLAEQCGLSMKNNCCTNLRVSGGSFTMGSATTTVISDFSLDVYEVTVGRFRRFVDAFTGPPAGGAGAHPAIANSGWQPDWDGAIAQSKAALISSVQCDASVQTWKATGAHDALPINCISWYEAFAFCAWDRGRLPTEAEWESAAKGGSESRWYPWGNNPIPSGFQDDTATYANYNCLGDGSPESSCTLADILRVGSKPLGLGKYGQLDMSGSVREWTLDSYNPLPASCNDCASLSPSAERVARGGDWSSAAMYLASDNRLSNIPDKHYPFMGIRCARDL